MQKFILGFTSLFLVSLLLSQPAGLSAQSHCTGEPPNPSEAWTEFTCQSNACESDVLSSTVSKTCSPRHDANGCVVGWNCTTQHSSPSISQDCTVGQACNGSTQWTRDTRTCECSGVCYPPPPFKDFGDSTLNPKNTLETPNTPKLPLNIGWDNAQSIMNNVCPVRSYSYEIEGGGTTISGLTQELPQAPPAPPALQKVIGECQLKPSTQYSANVKACIDKQGNNCGGASVLEFTTSSAPELKTPYDPDWEGPEKGESLLPAALEWCQAPPATNFYNYQIYRDNIQAANLVWEDFVSASKRKFQEDSVDTILRIAVGYVWRVAGCQQASAQSCGPFSQAWSFVTQGSLDPIPLLMTGPVYQSGPPEKIPVINTQDTLTWTDVPRVPYYLLHIEGGSLTNPFNRNWFLSPEKSPMLEFSFSKAFWQQHFAQNALYTWYVTACTAPDKTKCNSPSPAWKFKTVGAPPLVEIKSLDQGRTTVPIVLEWSAQEKTLSYLYELREGNTLVAQGKQYPGTQKISIAIPYQNEIAGNQTLLHKNTLYAWKVKSCGDQEATICGDWATGTVKTVDLAQAPLLKPTGEVFLPEAMLSWNRVVGANFYEYKVDYVGAPEAETQDCKKAAGTTLSLGNPISLGTMAAVKLQCIGNYQFAVQACLDSVNRECREPGPWSTLQQFSAKEEQPGATGLVPCQRGNNDPQTPWDDRKPCGLGHFFLLVRNLVDFVLWKVSLFVLLVLAVIAGPTSYFSLGGPMALARIKTVFRSFFVGFLIMLFAWFTLNWVLGILEFNITIFGTWYEISL